MSEDTPAPDPEGTAAAMRAAQAAAEAQRQADEKAAADALAASLKAMADASASAPPVVIPMPPEIFARINSATLAEALRLAGLPGNCSADRVTLPMDASAETVAAVRALVAAHDPDAPPPPAPLPALTDRQFGEGLWRDGLISFEEYIGFVGPGVVPPPLSAIIETLPDDDTGGPTPRKVALGLVTGAQEYRFDNPLVDLVRQAKGWTVDHLRARWAAWATL